MSEADHLQRFRVAAENESETKTTVRARQFEFAVDEPEPLGGTDDAPNPVEYLLGAWAGCLNVVAHTVADERGVDLAAVDVEIVGDIDPRKFLGATEDGRAGYQEIRVQLDVETDGEFADLADFAAEVEERCPVGDNIGNATPTSVTIESN